MRGTRQKAVKNGCNGFVLSPSGYPGGRLIAMKEVEDLRKDLWEKTREKEEALVQLESHRPVRACNFTRSPRHNARSL